MYNLLLSHYQQYNAIIIWFEQAWYYISKRIIVVSIMFKKYFGKIPHNSIVKTNGNCQYNSVYQPGKKFTLEIS